MSESLTYPGAGASGRDQVRTLFAQTMGSSRPPPACSRSAPTWAVTSPAAPESLRSSPRSPA